MPKETEKPLVPIHVMVTCSSGIPRKHPRASYRRSKCMDAPLPVIEAALSLTVGNKAR